MHFGTASVLSSVAVAALCHCAPDLATGQTSAGLRVRVDVLKKATLEQRSSDGPVLIGPQSALELEWRVLNRTGGPIEIPSPATALRLRVSDQGRAIAVVTEWAADMTLRARVNGELVSTSNLPLGRAVLPEGSSLWVRGSTKLLDGSAFVPGDYVLDLDVTELQPVSAGASPTAPAIDSGFPIQVRILDLGSPERRRQFHMVEGAFYKGIDNDRALENYVSLASLPGASWSDWLPLARMYGELGMHHEATVVFRRILPNLIRSLESPLGEIIRDARHLRRAAMSFAAEGDLALAANLLRLEGRIPESRIPEEIERLRKSAPKPGGYAKQ